MKGEKKSMEGGGGEMGLGGYHASSSQLYHAGFFDEERARGFVFFHSVLSLNK